MLPRNSRRRRDTGPMFPFGEIMLPVIGLVALGILIIAVKMFFIPSQEDKVYKNIPDKVTERNISAEQTPIQKVEKTERAETVVAMTDDKKNKDDGQNNNNAIAVPVSGATSSINSEKKQESVSDISSDTAGKTVKKKVPSDAISSTGGDKIASSNSDWGVQIGSFRESSAARVLSEKARGDGYSVKIEKTSINGKEYNRVIVLAGKTRSNALEVEKKLKNIGYPTYVRIIN